MAFSNLFLFLAKDPFIFQNALVTKAGARCQREEEVEVSFITMTILKAIKFSRVCGFYYQGNTKLPIVFLHGINQMPTWYSLVFVVFGTHTAIWKAFQNCIAILQCTGVV